MGARGTQNPPTRILYWDREIRGAVAVVAEQYELKLDGFIVVIQIELWKPWTVFEQAIQIVLYTYINIVYVSIKTTPTQSSMDRI